MKEYNLYNRDGFKIFLRQVNDSVWTLNVPSDALTYMRAAIDEDNKVYMIDPPGGPMLMVGDKLDIGIIKAISWVGTNESADGERQGKWTLLIQK